ncbi:MULTISPECIES: Fic family protein [Rhodomicrobium]|uniref:Fic family protein n=1 Tax=Rhodomicrobium TaxID=1068 RepID=UPI001AECC001|nr:MULTISPECIES: Fic family protein [Rhodomicrobium]
MTEKLAKKLDKKPAKKLATKAAPTDRDELVSSMEPMLISTESRHRARLNELVFELNTAATQFRTSLPEGMVGAICDVVRSMNCYYSNLIEGHNTHPIDIERALAGDYSQDTEKRNLQKEAKAHIATQRWIDEGALAGKAATMQAVLDVHKRFESALPADLLWVEEPGTGRREPVVPGELRHSDVRVGQHIAISPGAVPRFLQRWEEAYARLGKSETVLQAAAAHHRLLWIHPFSDGNGRVARLISYAMLLEALNSGGIWSIARGLARKQDEYKAHLASCDLQRRNDLDGRGNLSEEELASFTAFFLECCLDQVKFMAELMQPAALRKRVLDWAKGEEQVGSLMPNSTKILAHILTHRELERKDMPEITGFKMDKARRVAALLNKRGIIKADTHKSPFRIAFPAELAPGLLPGLYPALPDRT